jgi:hypothetical protein
MPLVSLRFPAGNKWHTRIALRVHKREYLYFLFEHPSKIEFQLIVLPVHKTSEK